MDAHAAQHSLYIYAAQGMKLVRGRTWTQSKQPIRRPGTVFEVERMEEMCDNDKFHMIDDVVPDMQATCILRKQIERSVTSQP
eukprot:1346196-Amphidinium_carterae.2